MAAIDIGKFFKKKHRPNQTEKRHSRSWMSVGLKMMIGVGLISNLCIGGLIYVNFQTFTQVGDRTSTLLLDTAEMNQDLRNRISDLQIKYLEIPKMLEVNPEVGIRNWLKDSYTVSEEKKIIGGDNYRKLFKRSERRDISKGKFVVKPDDNKIFIYKGLMSPDGEFSDAVIRLSVVTDDVAGDGERIGAYIASAVSAAQSGDALERQILMLKSQLADEAIAAETSRTAILNNVEEMAKKKAELVEYRETKKQMIGLIALGAILINLVLIHFMVWFVIERPLKRLTRSIDRINKGEAVAIPYQRRRDRIGILSGAVTSFQNLLIRLKEEDDRKVKEQQVIQDMIQTMSGMIAGIQSKAAAMKENALELNGLAKDTQQQTATATESASKTVQQTDAVSVSTRQLKSAVENISEQVARQAELVTDINDVTHASQSDMVHLTQASDQINEIVNIVKNISKETKLLALNARIEAARSGRAGKGFTVVAREIRDLSIQTEDANEEIARKIESIQTASNIIIAHNQSVERRVERLTEASQLISAAVEEQRAVTSEIAENADATTVEMKNVSGKIGGVKAATRETSRFAGDVQSYSEQIALELSNLLEDTRHQLATIGIMGVKEEDSPADGSPGASSKGDAPKKLTKTAA